MGEERYIVVAGDVNDVVGDPDIQVLERLDAVLIARTTPERSAELSARSGVVVSVYASEPPARVAFDLFRRERHSF